MPASAQCTSRLTAGSRAGPWVPSYSPHRPDCRRRSSQTLLAGLSSSTKASCSSGLSSLAACSTGAGNGQKQSQPNGEVALSLCATCWKPLSPAHTQQEGSSRGLSTRTVPEGCQLGGVRGEGITGLTMNEISLSPKDRMFSETQKHRALDSWSKSQFEGETAVMTWERWQGWGE